MDTHSLVQALQALNPKEYDWKFCLYSYRKSRDGAQLSWNHCEMEEIARWVEQHARFLLEKTLLDRVVTEYSPLIPKEEIGALSQGDPQIRDQIGDVLLGIAGAETKAPEDFANGVVNKPVGYAFYGLRPEKKDDAGEVFEPAREVIFLRRANPFISGAKALLAVGKGDAVAEAPSPLLKFTPQTDFLLVDGISYLISESIAKDFDLETRANAVCARRLEQINEADVAGSYEQLELVALGGKHTKKFLEFDKEILDHIASLSINSRADFLSVYGIALDADGKMNSSDPEQCEMIIDLLCGRTCTDVLGRLAVGVNIKPRE
ncbi:MAG: hypothetical protein LBB50_03260 [Oscillospiraceae bacterium]|jgi:hypothetical protein|nr:hypothetical protein [Oscillospiraceae bacterium]